MASRETVDRSAPGVQLCLQVDGAEERLDLGDRLLGFSFEDSDNKTDKATIQVDNWDLRFFQSRLIAAGALLEVSWGYPGRMSPVRSMVIRNVKGFAALQIEAHDRSVLLNNQQRCRVFESVTRSDVARQIAEENGFTGSFVEVEATEETFDCINQIGETDARLMRRLARREGFRFYIDETGFHWHSRRFGEAPVKCYRYFTDPQQGSLLLPTFEKSVFGRPGRVRVRGRNAARRADIEESGSDAETERDTLGEVIEMVDPQTGATSLDRRNATESVRNTAASTEGRARREANARFRNASRHTIQMKFPAVGDPEQLAKSIVEIEGLTELLSGRFYVENVKHRVVPLPYIMTMELTKDGTGRLARRVERARQSAGRPNRQAPREENEPRQVEVVDPVTGETRIEYRRRR